MAPQTTLENRPSENPDKPAKAMDHGSSDIGSVPATSQAVVHVPSTNSRSNLARIVTALTLAALIAPAIYLRSFFQPAELLIDPTDYAARTKRALSQTPLIDGHNDLPYLIRVELRNKIYDGFDLKTPLLGHTDILRMRKGQVGGQFWSCYVECPGVLNPELYKQENLDQPTWIVRDTLEQIDVTKRLIAEHPDDLQYCDNPRCIREAFKAGKVASMIGIEGGHQAGSSLGSIRQFYDLGARYITTTHNCDNTFATAASTVAAGGEDRGLTPFGYEYVKEMNRLGMMIDLSHTSHQTMRDVLSVTRAPIIFSHSGSYTTQRHLRHVPDDVLRSVKRNGGIVMVTFVCRFLNMQHPELASIHDVVDHIIYIANLIGWEHVGVGSDFSGTPGAPIGLEDVSKYPDLVGLLMARGATDEQVRLFAGENLIRVWENIEAASKVIQATGEKPDEEIWEGRSWKYGHKSMPFMFSGSREKFGGPDGPHQFHVNADGKHVGLIKDSSQKTK